MPEGLSDGQSDAAARARACGAVLCHGAAALDAAAFAYAGDAYARAAMVHLAMRASLRGSGLTFLEGRTGGTPFRLAYYPVESSSRARLRSGVLFSDSSRDTIACALSALDDVECFEIARLGLPHFRKSGGIWTMTAPRREGGRLLVLGFPMRTLEILPLADSYEAFLAGLGKHTRRNLRNYRKKAETTSVRFTPFETPPPAALGPKIEELAARNLPRPLSPQLVAEKEQSIAAQPNQFHSTLSDRDGGIFSLCRGFIWQKCAVVVYQLNDRRRFASNPSLLHRAFLAEWLIARGIGEIVFVDGLSGILRKAALPDASSTAVVVPVTAAALAKAVVVLFLRLGTALGLLAALLPSRLREHLGLRHP